MDYGLDGQDSIPGRGKIFRLSIAPRPALRATHPLTQWEPGALSVGVKRSGRQVDHSTQSSAEV
jgi:hypothetical protein